MRPDKAGTAGDENVFGHGKNQFYLRLNIKALKIYRRQTLIDELYGQIMLNEFLCFFYMTLRRSAKKYRFNFWKFTKVFNRFFWS